MKRKRENIRMQKKYIITRWRSGIFIVCIVLICTFVQYISNTPIGHRCIDKVHLLLKYNDTEAIRIALWQGQLTLSVLVLSIAALINNNVSDRLLGSSIKGILFKDEIWLLNYPETMLSMFLLLGISTYCVLKEFLYPIIILFFTTWILVGWLSYLTYIISVKRSRIYFKITRVLEKKETCINNGCDIWKQINRANRLYESLILGCMQYRKSIIEENRSYIIEEIILLDYLITYCATRNNEIRKKLLESILVEKVKKYIGVKDKGDDKGIEDELLKHLCRQVKKEHIVKWIQKESASWKK